MKIASSSRTKKVSLIFPGLLLVIVIVSGVFLVLFLARTGMASLVEQSGSAMEAMSMGIQNELLSSQSTVGVMAGSPWILPALLGSGPENIEKANSVLDRYNNRLGFSVCYLLDSRGNTIASSNRNTAGSFVGQNYAFRPYFQEAMRGTPWVYMAIGVTSQERGFYVSYPVKNENGKIVGVAVIKKNVEAAEGVLKKPCALLSTTSRSQCFGAVISSTPMPRAITPAMSTICSPSATA